MEAVLTDERWAWIERTGRCVRFRCGDRLLNEGDESDHVYAIRSGQVKALAVSKKGDEILLAVRGPNQTIGELAALNPGPRESSVIARGDVEAWVLTKDQYLQFLYETPGAALAQLMATVTRFREIIRQYVERSDDLTSRIASRLRTIADDTDSDELTLTQHELATWVGASREATVRCLSRLRTNGVIDTGRGTIVVLDRERLSTYC